MYEALRGRKIVHYFKSVCEDEKYAVGRCGFKTFSERVFISGEEPDCPKCKSFRIRARVCRIVRHYAAI